MPTLFEKLSILVKSERISNLLGEDYPILEDIFKNSDFKLSIDEMEKNCTYSYKPLLNGLFPLLHSIGYKDYQNFHHDLYSYALSLSFPDKFEYNPRFFPVYELFMLLLKEIYSKEANTKNCYPYSNYKVEFVHDDIYSQSESSEEYSSFLRYFYTLHIYEVMRLGREIHGFNTIDHVIMIHFLAVKIAKQMNELGFDIDIPKVSAASLGHDIGKFGCVKNEVSRVPYLHYYYTDKWFKDNDMPIFAHIATNHSVWDLELENLPIESLILIYSDFRVKNNEKGVMSFFNLEESFNVILSKLDNVDDTKSKRYRKAYSRLKDFENYIVSLGIDISDNESPAQNLCSIKPYSLLFGEDVTQNLKFYSISKNIKIMHLLRSEASLTNLLEYARTERNPIRLREYIDVFREYSTHLSQRQKQIMMKFLFEMLLNPEEDIRIECANLLGRIVSDFDEEYRKEIPQNAVVNLSETDSVELFNHYCSKMLSPDIRVMPIHKKWLGIAFSYFAKTVSIYIVENRRKEFEESISLCIDTYSNDKQSLHYLLLSLIGLDIKLEITSKKIIDLALSNLKNKDIDMKSLSLLLLIGQRSFIQNYPDYKNILLNHLKETLVEENTVSLNHLYAELAKGLEFIALEEKFESAIKSTKNRLSDIFLNNLKTATSFVQKIVNIDILEKNALENITSMGAYTAMHFCNILKVSETEIVRNKAGKSVIELFPYLNIEQRNDISIELIRSLEMQDYKFSKFIPNYLGEILLYLTPKEFDEVMDDFEHKVKTSQTSIDLLIIRTIGKSLSLYSRHSGVINEGNKNYKRMFRMLGILMASMVHYDNKVRRASLDIISKDIFSCLYFDSDLKDLVFEKICKKILTLLPPKSDDIGQLSIGTSMNRIYRYLSDKEAEFKFIKESGPSKIAFFPGTFDPFTLSHKNIAKSIRDLGFQVYLSVDEFSWSKRTQPHMIRREIARMSVADELDIYLYPSSMPVNIANDNDLDKLLSNFPDKEVYIAAGKDVILNASAYKSKGKLTFIPHIVFERPDGFKENDVTDYEAIFKNTFNAPYVVLNIEDRFKYISSTLIRSSIDQNRDISEMVDPLCEKYIYEKGLYKKEPLFKSNFDLITRKVKIYKRPSMLLIESIAKDFKNIDINKLHKFMDNENSRCITIVDEMTSTVLGFSVFKWIPSTSLYSSFKDKDICDFIRSVYIGRMVHLGGIFGDFNTTSVLLTETLTYSLERDYTFMIYHDKTSKSSNSTLEEMVTLSGFNKVNENKSIYYVNMSNPCTLNLDIENYIKEPFLSNKKIQSVIWNSRIELRKALNMLYPSNLLIAFDNKMLNEKLVGKICEENNVPNATLNPPVLGRKMCVPFGHVLSKLVVPNTVSKSLHTEKIFKRGLDSFTIRGYPYYLPLERQVKTIKSFGREIILVDDILNKGYRINALNPILKDQNIKVAKVIVGILTGRGKELMQIQGRETDSAYFIPKLKVWFNEGILYPFISGDGIEGANLEGTLIPSINLILPYSSPTYIKDATNEAIFDFSMTCLQNSKNILKALEEEYEELFERKLTLSSLNEVLVYPRIIDYGNNLSYSKNNTPSSYLEDDIEKLNRLKKIILR